MSTMVRVKVTGYFVGSFWRDDGKRRVSLTGRESVNGLGTRQMD